MHTYLSKMTKRLKVHCRFGEGCELLPILFFCVAMENLVPFGWLVFCTSVNSSYGLLESVTRSSDKLENAL